MGESIPRARDERREKTYQDFIASFTSKRERTGVAGAGGGA